MKKATLYCVSIYSVSNKGAYKRKLYSRIYSIFTYFLGKTFESKAVSFIWVSQGRQEFLGQNSEYKISWKKNPGNSTERTASMMVSSLERLCRKTFGESCQWLLILRQSRINIWKLFTRLGFSPKAKKTGRTLKTENAIFLG